MALSEYEERLIANIGRDGWQCTMVGAGNAGEPAFAYTIGLWETHATPELIVFGLDLSLMHGMLDRTVWQLEKGAKLSDGARWSDLIRDFDCVSRPVHRTQLVREYFNSALWYRSYRTGDELIEAYQLFWPGKLQGLFPWEPGCDPLVRECQPQLYLPRETGLA